MSVKKKLRRALQFYYHVSQGNQTYITGSLSNTYATI
jgi:hypothetical protein